MTTTERENDAWTVARLVDWTREHFRKCGLESPRLSAELLLAHCLGCERIQLYARWDAVPGDDARAKFRALVAKAAAHRPIAYLLGTKEFFSMPFEVTPDVLIPRPETEILVERALELARAGGDDGQFRVLDLCTGSGCIAISIAAHAPHAAVTATDISSEALTVARRNAARHSVADRIEFHHGDLYAALAEPDRFDAVVCNPPYVAEADAGALPKNVRDYEPHMALFAGPDGLAIIRRVVAGAADRLSPGGHLLLEVAYDQAATVRALFAESQWGRVISHRDLGGHERVVHATRSAETRTQVA